MTQTTATAAKNRRRSQRRKPRSTVKVECRKGSSGLGSNLATQVMDLSDTGVRMVVSQELALNAEVEVTIAGYGLSKTLKRVGAVCWQLKLEDGAFCVGIAFQKQLPYRDWQNLASPN